MKKNSNKTRHYCVVIKNNYHNIKGLEHQPDIRRVKRKQKTIYVDMLFLNDTRYLYSQFTQKNY